MLVVATVLVIVVLVGLVVAWPRSTAALASRPRPVKDYSGALLRAQAWRTREPPDMNPVGRLLLQTHGSRTARAVVLVHGYTNCPEQFRALAQRLYDLGDNVLAAPVPHHGLADRMTPDQARLSAEELVAYADEVVDIAQGLGEKVIVVGFSMGGVVAAWAAQTRKDVALAQVISPAFGLRPIPAPLTTAALNVATLLPGLFIWWDPRRRGELGPAHAYPRYSTRALGQIMRLGLAVLARARQAHFAAGGVVVVTNASDMAVNNARTAQVVLAWRGQGADVTVFEFGAHLGLQHDLIDPAQPEARTDIVYPKLIELTRSWECHGPVHCCREGGSHAT